MASFLRAVLYMLPFFCFHVRGQDGYPRSYGIGTSTHYGYIMRHTAKMAAMIKGHVYGGETSIIFPAFGDKEWQRIYRYPDMGIAVMYTYLANPEELGNLYAFYPFINFPLIARNKFRIYLRTAGNGIAYTNLRFHRTANHKNVVVGSYFNSLVVLRFNGYIYLTKRMRLETGLGLTHFSNGAFRLPNLGINANCVSLGFTWLQESSRKINTDSVSPPDKRIEKSLLFSAFAREIEPEGGPKYPVFVLSFNLKKSLNHKSRVLTGLDISHSSSIIERFHIDTVPVKSNMDAMQVGLKIGYELTVSRLSVPLEFGVYIHTKYKGFGLFYQRIGTRYRFSERWYGSFTLKSHFANADHFECGIGYIIK